MYEEGCITGNRINGLCDGVTGDWYVKFDTFHPAVDMGLPITRVISRITLQARQPGPTQPAAQPARQPVAQPDRQPALRPCGVAAAGSWCSQKLFTLATLLKCWFPPSCAPRPSLPAGDPSRRSHRPGWRQKHHHKRRADCGLRAGHRPHHRAPPGHRRRQGWAALHRRPAGGRRRHLEQGARQDDWPHRPQLQPVHLLHRHLRLHARRHRHW